MSKSKTSGSVEYTKRPLSAFFFYMKDFRASSNSSNKSISENAKIAGEKWKSMSDVDKKPYLALAEKDKKRYENDLKAGKVLKSKATKGSKQKKGTKEKKLRDPNMPKKPLTSYLLFLADFRKTTSATGTEIVKQASLKWKSLNESEKEKYVKAEQVAKKKYETEMEKYRKEKPAAKKTTKRTSAGKKVVQRKKNKASTESESEKSEPDQDNDESEKTEESSE